MTPPVDVAARGDAAATRECGSISGLAEGRMGLASLYQLRSFLTRVHQSPREFMLIKNSGGEQGGTSSGRGGWVPPCSLALVAANLGAARVEEPQQGGSIHLTQCGRCGQSGELFSRKLVESASLLFETCLEPQGDLVELG